VMVAYDAEKWRQEEKARLCNSESQTRYRAELDKQMVLNQSVAQQKLNAVHGGPPDVDAQAVIAARNRELDLLDEEKKSKLREQLLANASEDIKTIARRKQREELLARREKEDMQKTIAENNANEHDVQVATKRSHTRRRHAMLTQVEAARESRARRKEEDRQADRECIAENERVADIRDAKTAALKEARLARIQKVMNTIGAKLQASEEEHEAAIEERVTRDCAEMDRQHSEAIERKRLNHSDATKELVAVLGRQVEFKGLAKEDEQVSKQTQAAIVKKRFDDGEIEEAAKLAKRRNSRATLDAALIGQIREQIVIHPEDFGSGERHRRFELAYNKKTLDHMCKEGWRPDCTDILLRDAGDRGKLGHNLSIPRFEGTLHPLELQSEDL